MTNDVQFAVSCCPRLRSRLPRLFYKLVISADVDEEDGEDLRELLLNYFVHCPHGRRSTVNDVWSIVAGGESLTEQIRELLLSCYAHHCLHGRRQNERPWWWRR